MLPTPEAFAASLGKATAPHMKSFLGKYGRPALDRLIVSSINVFKAYVTATIEKCRYTKNILYRDSPMPLLSQYVANGIRHGAVSLTDTHMLEKLKADTLQVLVIGHAGSGKSMLMKWLSLRLAETILEHQKIPIFVELRNLSPEPDDDLPDIVFKGMQNSGSRATVDQFRIGLEYGLFIVLLDGLDELQPTDRTIISKAIKEFGVKYPNTSILCSTRPDLQVESTTFLSLYRLEPMTLEQIVEVVSKVLFDEERKREFIQRLRRGLYAQHQSFLSNPLLALVMLITFDSSVEIPTRLTVFYGRVYETLFNKHDSSKGIYERKRHTSLEIDQFESVLKWFCFITYAHNEFDFDDLRLTSFVRDSLVHAGFAEVIPQDFIEDCKQSLSLLQDDGLGTSFVHRSFQEYFAARYVAGYQGESYIDLLNSIALRSQTDRVLSMAYEIAPATLKRKWIVPNLERHLKTLQDADLTSPDGLIAFLQSLFSKISVHASSSRMVSPIWTSGSFAPVITAVLDILNGEEGFETLGMLEGHLFGDVDRSIYLNFLRFFPVKADCDMVIDSFGGPGGRCEAYVDAAARRWIAQSNISSMLINHKRSIEKTLHHLTTEAVDQEALVRNMVGKMDGRAR